MTIGVLKMKISDELLDMIADEYIHEVLRFNYEPSITFYQYLEIKLSEMRYNNE